jgi:Ca-activated chloride channel family protein
MSARYFCRAACALLLAVTSDGQQQAALQFRADSRLVLVPVSVQDERSRAIIGLHRESFRIFDDGAEQTVSHFDTEQSPVALGIVFDTSASMRRTAPAAPLALAEVLGMARKDDEFLLIEFQDTPRLIVPLTRDPAELARAIGKSPLVGRTALYDAILFGLREISKSASTRRALLVVTDGIDNQSLASTAQLDRALREAAVPIYTLAVVNSGLRTSDLMAIEWLRRTAELTGGRKYESRAADLQEFARRIADDVRSGYVLGFQPSSAADGRYHRLHVAVSAVPGISRTRAAWRQSYVSGPSPLK